MIFIIYTSQDLHTLAMAPIVALGAVAPPQSLGCSSHGFLVARASVLTRIGMAVILLLKTTTTTTTTSIMFM